MYKEIKIDKWGDFVNFTLSEEYVSWAFRGQSDSRWPIYSTLSRYLLAFNVNKKAWPHQEERILRIFKRKAHHFLKNIPPDNDVLQWLSLMQHHGAPTRIIDFTWSPFIAAFFALHRSTTESAVWAIYPPGFDYRKKVELKDGTVLEPGKLWIGNDENYKRLYVNGTSPFVIQGDPQAMNERLIVQSGTFAIPSVIDKPLEELLLYYKDTDRVLVKFVLNTKSIRDEAMSYFHVININESTLFPGMDGMARSIAYELEYHWAYNPKTMVVNPGYDDPPYGLPDNIKK